MSISKKIYLLRFMACLLKKYWIWEENEIFLTEELTLLIEC